MAGKKLLVADDSLTIQKVIRLALSNEGYEIQAVSDGNDAIQQISLFRPDVVLIDVSLPGRTAFEVKRAINAHDDLTDVRFVLMSSAFEKVDEEQSEEVVFHGRLTKPFDPGHLREVLSGVLAQVTTSRMEPTLSLDPRPTSIAPSESDDEAAGPLPPPSASALDLPPLPSFTRPPELPPELAHPPMPPLGGESPGFKPVPRPSQIQAHAHAPAAPSAPSYDKYSVRGKPGGEPAISLETELTTPPARTPSAPTPEPPRDADIKQLTESTIRMSGLDDFDWTVQEPSLKPPAGMLTEGLGSRDAEFTPPPEYTPTSISGMPAMPGIPGMMAPPPPASGEAMAAGDTSPSMFSAELEEIVRKRVHEEVEATLSRMAQRMLPEIAERLIKEEIRRMLTETQG